MTIWGEMPPASAGITVRELFADNLTHNISLLTTAGEVIAVCAATVAVAAVVWRIFSGRGGRVGLMVQLWLKAKESELRERAGGTHSP